MSIKVCNIRLDKQHLEIDQNKMNAFLDTVTVKLTSSNFVTTGTTDYWSVLIFYETKKTQAITPIIENELTGGEKELYELLKIWRNNKASESNVPHYIISRNAELMSVAVKKPKNISELKKIKGFGEIKTEKFGPDILAVMNLRKTKKAF